MFEIPVRQCWKRGLGIVICGAIVFAGNRSLAQITPDSTLPNNSNVQLNGSTFNITGGTQAGANLFHSFQQFSVPTNFTASFNNAANIQNILSRVTGGSISNINGLIRANGTANLFLINPNGIIFGSNASLNIGGSFVGSTANAIQFGNSGIFSASIPEAPSPLLTINPSALLFNQIAAASIQNSSVAPARQAPIDVNASGLRVPDGRSLVLVGGDIKMDGGNLNAFGGRVELGGLASSGTVGLEVNGNNLSLSFPDNATRADVSLTNRANVNVLAAGGGSIAVNARNLNISGGSFLAAGIGEGLGSIGSQAGDITLNATGGIKIVGVESGVFNNVRSQAVGNGGNINITTGSLSLNDDAVLDTTSFGQGNAGSVSVRASGAVELAGGGTAIFSSVELGGVGKGGNIDIKAASLSLKDGAQLLTFVGSAFDNQPAGRGDAGNVTVDVTGSVTIAGVGKFSSGIFSTVDMGAVGNGGNITIASGDFSLTDGGRLAASTAGQGNAGNVTVDVTGSVTIAGVKNEIRSEISSRVNTGAVGTGGNITISSGDFSLSDGAQLSASTFGQGNAGNVSVRATNSVELVNGAIFSTVEAGGVGNGGNINITTGSFSLTDGAALIASTLGQGNAGSVSVRATNSVELVNAYIFSTVEAGGVGNGGNINITTGSFSLTDDAALTTSTLGQGNAGSVSVRATNSVELVNGNIFSTVAAGGVGNGGNININAATLSLKDSAQLATAVRKAFSDQPPGRGNAGNVTIDVIDPVTIAGVKDGNPSAIFSSVETGGTGNGGNITISSSSFSLRDRARLNASTSGQGNAGSVSVRASNAVELVNGGILSTVERGAEGKGGNININAASVSLKDDAQITASSTGDGAAGNIEVDTRSIRLSDRSSISANTIAGQGNINLRPRDLLLLRRGSNITTNATGTATGGNITINTNNLLAVPNENSDISANAQESFGGRVNINTRSIFGIQFRQQDTLFSDITASSELGPQFGGSVEINRPDVDPTQALVELPVNVVDASQQIDTSCRPDSKQQRGSFVITGRGSLRPSPYDMLTPQVINLNLATLEPTTASHSSASPVSKETPTKLPEPIVEATGLVRNDKGEVFLVANSPVVTPHSPWFKPASCSARREAE